MVRPILGYAVVKIVHLDAAELDDILVQGENRSIWMFDSINAAEDAVRSKAFEYALNASKSCIYFDRVSVETTRTDAVIKFVNVSNDESRTETTRNVEFKFAVINEAVL